MDGLERRTARWSRSTRRPARSCAGQHAVVRPEPAVQPRPGAIRAYARAARRRPDPLLNRAINQSYSAGLDLQGDRVGGRAGDRQVHAADADPGARRLTLPGSTHHAAELQRRELQRRRRPALIDALTISCNTAFAQLGIDLGEDKRPRAGRGVRHRRRRASRCRCRSPAARSATSTDDAAARRSSIGQQDVAADAAADGDDRGRGRQRAAR